MSTDLKLSVAVSIQGRYQKLLDLAAGVFDLNYISKDDFIFGTGINQVNKLFTDNRTLTTTAVDSLDLNAGGLLDSFGDVFSVTSIKAVIVASDPGNANTINFGGAASNAWEAWNNLAGSKLRLYPGGVICMTNPTAGGWPVTAGTGDILAIVNNVSSTQKYDIALIGF